MDLNKLKGQLQTEVDTAFLYESIAAIQTDDNLVRVLQSLGEIEKGHAKHMLDKVISAEPNYKTALPYSPERTFCSLDLDKYFLGWPPPL